MTDELNLSDMNWCKTEIERLRQRVKELEAEVEAECERRWAGNAESSKDIAILSKEIEELRKRQGEPVAWASVLGAYAHIVWGSKADDNIHTIPLYTSAPSYKPETKEKT